jgi:hypothetical protein
MSFHPLRPDSSHIFRCYFLGAFQKSNNVRSFGRHESHKHLYILRKSSMEPKSMMIMPLSNSNTIPPVGCHPRLIGDMYRWRYRVHASVSMECLEMDHAVIQPVFCILICQSSVSPTAADLAKFIFRKGLDEPSYPVNT